LVVVLQEIEREDEAWEQNRRRKPKHGRNLDESKALADKQAPSIIEVADKGDGKMKAKSETPPGFY